jgi:hypothetical protein
MLFKQSSLLVNQQCISQLPVTAFSEQRPTPAATVTAANQFHKTITHHSGHRLQAKLRTLPVNNNTRQAIRNSTATHLR